MFTIRFGVWEQTYRTTLIFRSTFFFYLCFFFCYLQLFQVTRRWWIKTWEGTSFDFSWQVGNCIFIFVSSHFLNSLPKCLSEFVTRETRLAVNRKSFTLRLLTGLSQWWLHSPSTNEARVWFLIWCRMWFELCWFSTLPNSTLLGEVSTILRFFALKIGHFISSDTALFVVSLRTFSQKMFP